METRTHADQAEQGALNAGDVSGAVPPHIGRLAVICEANDLEGAVVDNADRA
jgi:hypothetical protein